jgi:hypothetical protein
MVHTAWARCSPFRYTRPSTHVPTPRIKSMSPHTLRRRGRAMSRRCVAQWERCSLFRSTRPRRRVGADLLEAINAVTCVELCKIVNSKSFQVRLRSRTRTRWRAHTRTNRHTRHTPMHVKPESSSKKHHASSGQQAGPFRQLQRIGPCSSQSSRCLTRMLTRAGSYTCLAACLRVCATLLDAALGRKCAHEPALKRQGGSDPGHEILSTPTQWLLREESMRTHSDTNQFYFLGQTQRSFSCDVSWEKRQRGDGTKRACGGTVGAQMATGQIVKQAAKLKGCQSARLHGIAAKVWPLVWHRSKTSKAAA